MEKDFRQEIGKAGEEIALAHILRKGYRVREKNWRYKHKEIDIIAEKDDILVIVEVRSRTSTYYELPSESVTSRKIRFLVEAADEYVCKNEIDKEVRFDVISIVFEDGNHQLEHIEDAFYPPVN